MNEPAIFKLDEQFVSDIRNIIITARTTAIRSVDFERVKMYWKLGERIFIEEQKAKTEQNTEHTFFKTLHWKLKKSSVVVFPCAS